jgi:AbiJ N-terminal domain 4
MRYYYFMSILDLFSKRQKVLRGEVSDVYSYDQIPYELRVQLVRVFQDAFGRDVPSRYSSESAVDEIYTKINISLAKEYGLFSLGGENRDSKISVHHFLLKEENYERVIDLIEYMLRILDLYIRDNHQYLSRTISAVNPDEAIAEINERFRENGVGYRYENKRIIRVDSELIHSEIIKPVLSLLSNPIYIGANQEFITAFEHYRHKRYKESLVESLKALESTMKVICSKRKWAHSTNDPAKKLLDTLFANELIPNFMQSHFTSLRSMLESGVPTTRNKLGGHGQGTSIVEVPDYLASFAINSTASAILLLINAEKGLK